MMLTHVRNCRSEEIDLGTSELDTNPPHRPIDVKIRDRLSKAGARREFSLVSIAFLTPGNFNHLNSLPWYSVFNAPVREEPT